MKINFFKPSFILFFTVGLFFVFACLFPLKSFAATVPTIITYQGKVLSNNLSVTSTLSIKMVLYDAANGGSALYSATGTLNSPAALSITPNNGLFSIDLGGSGTNILDPTIFQNNQNIYLQVTINNEALSPRKQISASPFAFNALYLNGVAATSTASSSTYIPISDASGNFNFRDVTSTGLNVTGTSTLATTTAQALTVSGDIVAQAMSDALGWFQNQGNASKSELGYNNGGFGGGATPGNIDINTSSLSFFDTSAVDSNSKGFIGAVFDGRYVYFVPNGIFSYKGQITRYDTTGSFTATSSFSFFDTTAVNANSKGFKGAVFDGQYIYFIPNYNGASYSGQVTRYNTRGSFTDPSSYTVYDMTAVDANAEDFAGAVFDGRYIYYVPSLFQGTPRLTRYDTTGSFTSSASYSVFNMASISTLSQEFLGAVFDGRYIYFVPDYQSVSSGKGEITRYDTTGSFTSLSSYSTFQTRSVNANSLRYSGAVFDGRYIYYVPYQNPSGSSGQVMRYDTTASFTASSSYSFFDTTAVDANSNGFEGGVFDGRYVYFVPGVNQSNGTALITRYDTTGSFTNTSSYKTLSIKNNDSTAEGFTGAVFDGRYVYFVPTYNQSFSAYGKIARLNAYTGGVDVPNSLAKLARGSDLYITPSSTVLIGTTTLPNTGYQLYVDAGGNSNPGLGVNGYVRASGFITATATLDLAEQYPIDPTCHESGNCPEPGDVVCVSPTSATLTLQKCDAPYSPYAIGIVSTDPGFVLGGLSTDATRGIALAGRVPLKVSLENGPIQVGDRLTTSHIPGFAMRATDTGPTIGIALENYTAQTDSQTITSFVHVSDSAMGGVSTSTPENTASPSGIIDIVVNFFKELGVTIEQGIIHVAKVISDTLVANTVQTNTLCLNNTCITEDQLKAILQKDQIEGVGVPQGSSAVQTNNSAVDMNPPSVVTTTVPFFDSSSTTSTTSTDISTAPSESTSSSSSTVEAVAPASDSSPVAPTSTGP